MDQNPEVSPVAEMTKKMQSLSPGETSKTNTVIKSGDLKTSTEDRVEADATPHQSHSQNGEEDEDNGEDDGTFIDPGVNQPLHKRKKRGKRKPKSKRGLNAPTGFEEYYVDTPLTPAEYQEEQQLYNKDLPFIDRILTAIQRFERTRRLTPERRDIFYKYLAYGSVDIGPNMFQSVDSTIAKDSDMDKTQLATAMAQTSISSDKRDLNSPTSLYAVDFPGCLAGFLSRRAADWFSTETLEQVQLITTTLERFMDYLLQHGVCPEYAPSVLTARNLARTSATELWSISESHRWLPGDFNVACSTLFAGQYAQDYDGVTNWAAPDDATPPRDNNPVFIGLTQRTANQIMSFGIAGAADEAVYQDFLARATDDSIEVLETRTRAGFEITRIEPPSDECRKLYREGSGEFRPVGRVRAKPWSNLEAPPEDLTDAERAALKDKTASRQNGEANEEEETFTFLIEGIVQRHLFVGMKLEATLHRLNCGNTANNPASGLWFFDSLIAIFPSFDTYLCNEMLVGYKAPRMMPGKGHVRWFEGMGERVEEDDDDGELAVGRDGEGLGNGEGCG